MALTTSTPAEAKRQQEEDRHRAAALRNDRTEKRLNAQVEAALQSAASQAAIAEAAKRQALLAEAAAKKGRYEIADCADRLCLCLPSGVFSEPCRDHRLLQVNLGRIRLQKIENSKVMIETHKAISASLPRFTHHTPFLYRKNSSRRTYNQLAHLCHIEFLFFLRP